uniref:Uncharacterized protein n=1 Tax=Arundo donax TaxID=35708 RepID=A0A0A8YV54_ARUDO
MHRAGSGFDLQPKTHKT